MANRSEQGNGVIMENNPNADKANDGRGIDHAEDAYGDAVVGLMFGCGGHF